MNAASEVLDRLPPQDLEAERAILGSLIDSPKYLDAVAEIVRPDDFYADAHRRLFRTLAAMRDAGHPIERLTVIGWAKIKDELDAIGGAAYLVELGGAFGAPANCLHYADVVAKHARRREIIRATTSALREAYDTNAEPDATLDDLERGLAAVGTGGDGTHLATAEEAVTKAVERIDAILSHGERLGLPTGLDDFDDKIGGLFPGEFTVLSARSGVGKTALASQIVTHNAQKGRLVYFACLEMDPDELAIRMLCSDAEVDNRAIRTGKVTQDELARIARVSQQHARWPIRFDKRTELKVADALRTARRLLKDELRLVVLDYLQILDPDDLRESRERQVAAMSRALKGMARELKVPVLVLCQSNRDAEKDKKPSLRHLRESDAIGQNADVVLILETGDVGTDKEREATLTVAKNRYGPKGKLYFEWIPERTLFKQRSITRNPNYNDDFGEYGG